MPDLGENSLQEIIVYLDNPFSCFFKTRKITLILRIYLKKKYSHSGNCKKRPGNFFPVEFFVKHHHRRD